MKHLKPLIFGAFAINVVSFAVVGGLQVSRNISSTTALTARQSALKNIAKHKLSDTCWKYPSNHKLKIGDPIITPGSETGKAPTSCFYSPTTEQFMEAGYQNSELIVLRIFSIKEVQAAESQVVQDAKND